MHKSNYIVYDCETGGLEPTNNPITQFAAIIMDFKTLKEIDRWETFVRPYNDLVIDQIALDKTMVTMSEINGGIDIKTFNNTLVNFLEEHRAKTKKKEVGRLVPIGHNVTFDNGFLEYALNISKKNFFDYIYQNFIDTYPLAKLAFGLTGEEKLNLTASCEKAKIRLTDAHGAMNDVEATADLFRWFGRKLRNKKGDGVLESTAERVKGKEFFEFKCGAK